MPAMTSAPAIIGDCTPMPDPGYVPPLTQIDDLGRVPQPIIDTIDALRQIAHLAGPFGGEVASILEAINKALKEINKFLDDSLVKPGLVQSAIDAYLQGARNAKDAGQGATSALQQLAGWKGYAADAARASLTTYIKQAETASGLLTQMSHCTHGAADQFIISRNAAVKAIRDAVGRIQAAKPSVGKAAADQGLKWLIPGWAAADAAREYAQMVVNFARTLCTEIRNLVGNILNAAKPGLTEGCRQLGTLTRHGETCTQVAHEIDPSIPAVPHGTTAPRARGTGPTEGDPDAFDACKYLENHGNPADLPPGYKDLSTMTPSELAEAGITPEQQKAINATLTDPNGFEAKVLLGPDGKVIVAFGGTDLDQPQDIAEDVIGSMTFSPQSASADRVIQQLQAAGLTDNAVYTGHSLGGRLAAVAAASTGGTAVTFNAAGVSDPTLGYYAGTQGTTVEDLKSDMNNGGARAYNTDDDILTKVQRADPIPGYDLPDAPGSSITVDGTQDEKPWWTKERWDPTYGHRLNNTEESVKRHWETNPPR